MSETNATKRPDVKQRREAGLAAQVRTPLSSHRGWVPAVNRPDPVTLLEAQNVTRESDLVPVRHGRMSASPFTFYRGAAKIMATDLASTPTAGLTVQLCGDAHLSNFGLFGSPERTLLFDLNDFDETLPGPFEYDVKRMAASFNIAARNNGYSKSDRKSITRNAVRAYREAILEFSEMTSLDLWYAHLSESDLRTAVNARTKAPKGTGSKRDAAALENARRKSEKLVSKARTRDSLQALSKLAEVVDGQYRIVNQPPVVIPARELGSVFPLSPSEIQDVVVRQFESYKALLQPDRQHLLDRYEIVDVARKVVGVGSVGTRGFIVLLMGRDEKDPLFLQVKEATKSVLEDHLPQSQYHHSGERVVQGQRMMQAASDIFLGWTRGEQEGRYLYWRQLRDMKGSVEVETMIPFGMNFYAGICGWTLARAHARSGDVVALAEYLGLSDEFDRSIGDFSERYAEQNEADYATFMDAIGSGRIAAVTGV